MLGMVAYFGWRANNMPKIDSNDRVGVVAIKILSRNVLQIPLWQRYNDRLAAHVQEQEDTTQVDSDNIVIPVVRANAHKNVTVPELCTQRKSVLVSTHSFKNSHSNIHFADCAQADAYKSTNKYRD
jgi:hypothetical protein